MLHASRFLRSLALTALIAPLTIAPGCANDGTRSCSPECGTTQQCCNGACVFVEVDRNNCGMCGNVCAGTCSGGVCTNTPPLDGGPVSMCAPICGTEERCCGTICVDQAQPLNVDGRPPSAENPTSPFNNCDGCGLRCDPERAISCSVRPTGSSRPECACGEFAQCLEGDVCAQDQGRFTCINFSNNPRHCGGLNQACAEGEDCTLGECGCGSTGAPCAEGQACCNRACVDVSSDAANCGACGTVCTPEAPACQEGSCTCPEAGRACTAPMGGLLGGDPGESCCPGLGCVANTTESCACTACPDGEECGVGTGIFGGIGGMGMGTEAETVCCGDPLQILILGCGDFGLPGLGDGGFGLPGFDGGLPLPDGGVP